MAVPDRLPAGSGSTIEVDAIGFASAAEALSAKGFKPIAEKRVKHALRQSANSARAHIKQRARRHRRTGRLVNSIHTTWKGAGLNFMLRVGSTDPVAHLIVKGVRPHRIEARVRPLPLGGERFATFVEHPGFRGDPFVAKGIKDAMLEIQTYVDEAAEQMVKDLARKMKVKS